MITDTLTAPTSAATSALTADTARALTDKLRLTLTAAHELLIEAFVGRAHEALNYGPGAKGWRAYCAAEFGELLYVRLPAALRRDAFRAMSDAGMSVRNIAAPFGISVGTVHADLTPAPEAPATPPPAAPLGDRVVSLLAAHPAGLDVFAVTKRLKVRQAQVSPALCRLAAAGRIAYLPPARRGQTGTYRV